MPSQNSVDNNAVEQLTTAQINALTPEEGKAIYDTDINAFKTFDSNNPNVDFTELQYEQHGNNNDGVVKVNGYFPTPITCTFTNGTNLVNAVGHPMLAGDKVAFKATTGTLPAEITQDHEYFVINPNVNDFQISLTMGGPVFNFTDNGTPTTVFYDLSAAAVKQSLALVALENKFISYPPTAKLEISSSTDWPPNNTQTDQDFYNLDQPGTETGDTTSATNTIINMSDTSNLNEGMLVEGTGIPAETTIRNVDSPTQITITEDATATNAGVTFTFYDNKFLENDIEFQATRFRLRVSYTKASSAQDEILRCTLTNPLSGFMLVGDAVIQRQTTSGVAEFEVTSIADTNSIGEGYTFSFVCTDALTTLEVEDVTRFSAAKARM